MKRAICLDIESAEDTHSCKQSEHYNQCCQDCHNKDCKGCDYRYDNSCIVKDWVDEQ